MAMSPRHGNDEHCEWDALATAYALSALEPDEEAQFVPHLATCPQCTETVREAARTVGDLAYAVPDEEPPPALKERLMALVAQTPRTAVPPPRSEPGAQEPGAQEPGAQEPGAQEGQLGLHVPPTQPPSQPPPSVPPAATPGRDLGGQTVVPLRRPRRWQIAAAAAAVAAIAGLGVWNAMLRADQNQLRACQGPARVAELSADRAEMGTLVVRPGCTEVINRSLRPNGTQDTYWLWGMPASGAPVPLGGFDVRSDQPVSQIPSDRPDLNEFPRFAVSAERAGITPTKPDRVIASGDARG
jgi:anti-sigma-K factor RskA